MNTKYLGTFPKSIIFKLPNPQIGELVIASDTNEAYRFTENGWELYNKEGSELNLNLFDLNCSIIGQTPALTQEQINDKIQLINDFVENTNQTFYMLLGKQISYYTLFAPTPFSPNCEDFSLGEGVIDCLRQFKEIKSIEKTESDAIEIWIQYDADIITCLYLFPYDIGVVGYES